MKLWLSSRRCSAWAKTRTRLVRSEKRSNTRVKCYWDAKLETPGRKYFGCPVQDPKAPTRTR